MLCKRKAKEKPLCLWNSELISSPSGLIAKPLHQSVSTSAVVALMTAPFLPLDWVTTDHCLDGLQSASCLESITNKGT